MRIRLSLWHTPHDLQAWPLVPRAIRAPIRHRFASMAVEGQPPSLWDGASKMTQTTPLADEVTVSMDLQEGYQFLVDFHQDGVPALLMDEPQPLGTGMGPNAARVLAAAVGNCLSASAMFCLRRARVEVRRMRTSVTAPLIRNDRGRLRIGALRVRIQPEVAPADAARVSRCLELFEDYCVVTQSVRAGLQVSIEVEPAEGTLAVTHRPVQQPTDLLPAR
jgi:organic hydroperoxide reductase OsmC/OhrA